MPGRLAGKVALVTGAGRGVGRSSAVRLATEGADVIVLDVAGPLPDITYVQPTDENLAKTAALIEDAGRTAVPLLIDVRDREGLAKGVREAVERLGRLDVVVASAGICTPSRWDEVTPAQFQNTMDINVTGVWNTVMATAPHLVTAGGGSIILISSAAGIKAQPFMVHYVTSKFAERGMAKAFAHELARHHIRVNSVHPTGVETGMGGDAMGRFLMGMTGGDRRLEAAFVNMLPVNGISASDVSDTVLFLASDESRYVTAHELCPDAGLTEV